MAQQKCTCGDSVVNDCSDCRKVAAFCNRPILLFNCSFSHFSLSAAAVLAESSSCRRCHLPCSSELLATIFVHLVLPEAYWGSSDLLLFTKALLRSFVQVLRLFLCFLSCLLSLLCLRFKCLIACVGTCATGPAGYVKGCVVYKMLGEGRLRCRRCRVKFA